MPENNDDLVRVSLRIDPDLHKRMVAKAKKDRLSLTAWIVKLANDELNKGDSVEKRLSELEQRIAALEAEQRKE